MVNLSGNDVALVEVKNKKPYRESSDPTKEYFTIDREEIDKLAVTERKMGKPVLLVYKGSADSHDWRAIYLSEVLRDRTKKLKTDPKGVKYYAIDMGKFRPFDEIMDEDGISTEGLQRELFH